MAEIAAIEPNGLVVASTFSGCGGSCLGYRMAGYLVAWANEFTRDAQASYRANNPGSTLDPRDIRKVRPAEVLAALGLREGELDLFDGSPPCQAFSTAGKRDKGWGKAKRYDNGIEQCNERLFDEYARLLRGLRPRAFVAENVRGLVIGAAKGMYLEIHAALADCGYKVRSAVLDAQWLGTPQVRRRLIFVGIRDDLDDSAFAWPKPLPYRYSVRDAIGGVVRKVGSIADSGFHAGDHKSGDEPCPTLNAGGGWGMGSTQFGVIHDTGGFVRNLDVTDRPCPTITNGAEGMNSCHFKVVTNAGLDQPALQSADLPSPTVAASGPLMGASVVGDPGGGMPVERQAWLTHRTYGKVLDKLKQGLKSDKYLNLVRAHEDAPMPTATAIGGTAAGVSHPTECRKFSIAELRRLSGFPDDFVLKGSYAKQWMQLGNAVAPQMARAVGLALIPVLLVARDR